MWRVVVARPEESSAGATLLSSELQPQQQQQHPHHPHHSHHAHHHQHHGHPGQHQASAHHHPSHHWPGHHYPPPPPPPPPLAVAPVGQLQQHNLSVYTTQHESQNEGQEAASRPAHLKRPLSDSDGDDVFSEESGKEPCNSPGGDSCQHTSRKRRRGMIEKKRRDRINASLGELRRLVPAAARDPHSGKLEKAEILQLTVEHLRTLRNKGADSYDSTKLAMDYHAVGWGECVAEVGRYLVAMEGLDERDPLRLRLLSHLQSFHREQPGGSPVQQPAHSHPQQQPGFEQPNGQAAQAPASSLHLQAAAAATWPLAGQYPGAPAQYSSSAGATQYGPQQHGKPYRPWGAELAY